MVSVRIVNVDFYMSPPLNTLDATYSEFRGTSVHQVPIIRIFGSLPTGKKICLHVHGVFPYIYIPYDGSEDVNSVMYQISIALDKSLNVLVGQSSSNAQHVYKIALVSGRPIYGYHTKEHQFLKIYFYNPVMIKKAVTLLENGSIMGKCFQPHEAHLSYTLQFMIDYNLHGMSFIKLSEIRYRIDPKNPPTDINSDLYLPANVSRISVCELEGDVKAEHILNRSEIKQGEVCSNPGIVALWEDEKQRRRNKNVDSQISQCLSQTTRFCSVTASHTLLKQALQEKLASLKQTEQSTVNIDKNLSVYPAETPDSEDILNASSLLSQSLDVTLRNDTTLNESTFESDGVDLLEMLCEMAEKEAAEEGSLLSQVVNNPAESEGEDETEADLSLPLSPIKISQLDGNGTFKMRKKKGLDMPVLKNIDYTRERFLPDGKCLKFTTKKDRFIQPKKKPKPAARKYVKKPRRRLDLIKLISAIKSLCTLKKIEKTKTVKFRTVPSLAHFPTSPLTHVHTAKITSPCANFSHDVLVAVNRNNFSHEEITSSPLFPLLQEELNRISADNKELEERRKKDFVSTTLKTHSARNNGCKRRSCSVLKRYLFQLTEESSKLSFEEIEARATNFSCFVPNLFDMQCEVKKKIARKSITRSISTVSTQITIVQTKSERVSYSPDSELDENGNIKNPSHSVNSQITGDYKQVYISERRYMKIYKKVAIKQIRAALDGANDSSTSSSSSDGERDYRKISQRKPGTFSYSPLFVDENSTEKRDPDFRNVTKEIPLKNRLSKRKIKSTSGDLNLEADKTLVEEHLVCRLEQNTPKKRKKLQFYRVDDKDNTKCSQNPGPSGLHQISSVSQNTSSPEHCPSSSTSDSLTPYQKSRLQDTVYKAKSQNIEPTSDGCFVWVPKYNPPTRATIVESLQKFGLPEIRHKQPFYSNPEDVTDKIEIGNSVLKVPSTASVHCPSFQSSFNALKIPDLEYKTAKALAVTSNNVVVVAPVKGPPSRKEVEAWLKQNVQAKPKGVPLKVKKIKVKLPASQGDPEMSDDSISISPCSPESTPKATLSGESSETRSQSSSPVLGKTSRKFNKLRKKKDCSGDGETLRKSVVEAQFLANVTNDCQISVATLDNTHGFKLSLENLQDVLALAEHQHLLTLIMELHVQTRGDFKPDPQLDPIRAIFYGIIHDSPESTSNNAAGVFVVNSLFANPQTASKILDGTGVDCSVTYVDSESDLIDVFVKFLQKCDPDILTGYEIEMASWGYLIERGYTLGLNLPPLLSRIPNVKTSVKNDQKFSEDFNLPGRIVLDMWRLMRHEIALQSYTFENVVYHILHKRVPVFSFKDLSFWWEHKSCLYRHKTIDFYLLRIKSIVLLIEQLDLIGRTSELARLFGIQFFEVLSRGSQFRVESMMLRLAKPLDYIAVSPTVSQRAKMRAPEFLPLILEPESKFYADPVIVLDFQSLYPSMMIAYNYCFSTCVGRVEHLGKTAPFEFGATQLKISPNRVKKLLLKNKLNFSPCGVAFVNTELRHGILPRMLREILDTRLMVKKSMKQNKDNKTLQRVLHSRQLGLKLIANVTYGYTAANFSGRMPCVELGDSVVSKARETLQRAIDLVDKTSEWGAKVIYGDTDSMFVLVRGKSRADAFKIGARIAEAVTNDNPTPVKLKLEKVYQPCILQTKKRYVGYMYESPEQTIPEFDAKGIETVRRDGCPAASKMLEKCLKMLFDHCDVSLIKTYVLRQFNKILMGRISIQDLTFAKEYRGSSGYRPGACVPALELAKKWRAADRRNEPRAGQRVPYVIVNGPPGLPLIRLVRSPYDLLSDTALRPNALYYITRVIIPPINRCFNLIGVDLNAWFNKMPRKQFQYLPKTSPTKKTTISQFFMTTSCAVCGQQSQNGICENCARQPQTSVAIMLEKVRVWEQHSNEINLICGSCSGDDSSGRCISLDCPVLYQSHQAKCDLQQCDFVRQLIKNQF